MEGYLTNKTCTDSGTTMHSLLCIFGLLAGNIFQQQFYSVWYTWNVLLKSRCLCCAFRYHFLAWGMLQEVLSVWAAALQKAACHLYTVEGGQCTRTYHLQRVASLTSQNRQCRPKSKYSLADMQRKTRGETKYWCSVLVTKILMFSFGDQNIDVLFCWWILPQRSPVVDAK